MGRVCQNPKTWPEPEEFFKTQKTQTQKIWKFQNSNLSTRSLKEVKNCWKMYILKHFFTLNPFKPENPNLTPMTFHKHVEPEPKKFDKLQTH